MADFPYNDRHENLYSDDFKKRVLAAHAFSPSLPEIERALNAGSLTLGRYLEHGDAEIGPDIVLACQTIEEAHAVANRVLAQRQVWREWLEMMHR